MSTNQWRKMARQEETMLRATMPKTSERDTVTELRFGGVPARKTWTVPALTFKLAEVAR